MAPRSLRNRLGESTNIWPGFVDVLATLLIVIIFVLMIFTVSQIYLSDAISGRDKALQELRIQISELSKILQSEVSEKEVALETLSETESLLSGVQSDLIQQELITEGLQTDLAKKSSEIFVQEQNILALSGQITELLSELRIVAKALEVYEGLDSANLDTEGLGEKINKGQMIWKVPEMIAYLSRFYDIAAGDLIMSGTPAGVGPIERGDVMIGEVEGIGSFTVTVV